MEEKTGKTIIIVDDEPISRLDHREILESLGFRVLAEASGGFAAIELCEKYRPDIVMMDIKMPGLDGLDAAEAILSADLAGCVVLLTAFNDSDYIEKAKKAGVSGYLIKPVNGKELLPALEIAFSQSVQVNALRRKSRELERENADKARVEKAKGLLKGRHGMDELQAHAYLQKMSMSKRMTLAAAAEEVLSSDGEKAVVERAKQLLMRKGFPENRAFRCIREYGHACGMDVGQAAREILRNGGVPH